MPLIPDDQRVFLDLRTIRRPVPDPYLGGIPKQPRQQASRSDPVEQVRRATLHRRDQAAQREVPKRRFPRE